MTTIEYFSKSANKHIQPGPYNLYIVPEGRFMSGKLHTDYTLDKSNKLILACSGNRFKCLNEEIGVPEPKKTLLINKNLIHLNMSGHYWHFHHETVGQFLIYMDLNVFKEFTPENTAILVSWSKKLYDLVIQAFKHIFNFDILQYELIFAEENVMYSTSKNLITSTKTSTAGFLPLSFFSQNIKKYLIPELEPTEYIYVSRDDSDCRLLLNQEEIIQYLNYHNIPIKKVTMTGMPYLEQVNLFKRAKFVMSTAGSGTTNQIYCNPNKCKILFMAPKNGALLCSTITAKDMGMSYDIIEAEESVPPANKHRGRDKTCFNFNLDKEKVLSKVKRLLQSTH